MRVVLTIVTSPTGEVISSSVVGEDLFNSNYARSRHRPACPQGDYQAIKKAIDAMLQKEMQADRYQLSFYSAMWEHMKECGYIKTTQLVDLNQ